jgi:hypothetical protein
MSNVMVRFTLTRENPLRVKWSASDGKPGDGYKAQITAIVLPDGTRLVMHGSSLLEQTNPDGDDYIVTFTGLVGYADDHADFEHVSKLTEAEVDYELEFVHEDGHSAPADQFQIVDRPRAHAKKLGS